MLRRVIAGLCMVAIVFSVSSVWTQDDGPGKTETKEQGNFGYKFTEGQKLTWTASNTMTVEITEMPEMLEGMLGEDPIDIEFSAVINLTTEKVSKKGKGTFKGEWQKLSVKGNMIIQEIDFEYDADDKDAEEPDPDDGGEGFGGMDPTQALWDLVQEPVELTISRRGTVKITSDLGGGGGGPMGGGIGGILEQFLSLNGFMGKFSKKEIKEGDEWESESDFGLPGIPVGNAKVKATNKYTETKDGVAKIESTYKVGTSGSDEDSGDEGGGLPFAVDAKIVGKGTGTTHFDLEAGRVQKGTHKLDVDVELAFENPMDGEEMEIKANLKMTQKSKLENAEE